MLPTEKAVIEQLRQIFERKNLTPPDLSPESPVDASIGLESIDFAELVVRLEGVYGSDPFASGDVPQLQTIADLAALYS